MRTGVIHECEAVDHAILEMTMKMMTARLRRTYWAVRQGPGNGMEKRIRWGKGRGTGWEMVKGTVLLNCMGQT
jgi:hypothetical protein